MLRRTLRGSEGLGGDSENDEPPRLRALATGAEMESRRRRCRVGIVEINGLGNCAKRGRQWAKLVLRALRQLISVKTAIALQLCEPLRRLVRPLCD
jgi:hypothetical protein